METCSDCLAAQAEYAVLEGLLAETPSWENEVWREIDESQAEPTPPQSLLMPIVGLLAMAAAMLLWCAVDSPESTRAPRGAIHGHEIALRTATVAPTGEAKQVRGTTSAPGSLLTLEAQIGKYPFSQLRVYRDQHQLEVSCSNEPPCRRSDGTIIAEVKLEKIGRYQAILVVGDQMLPEPTGDLDTDVANASKTGRVVFAKEQSIR